MPAKTSYRTLKTPDAKALQALAVRVMRSMADRVEAKEAIAQLVAGTTMDKMNGLLTDASVTVLGAFQGTRLIGFSWGRHEGSSGLFYASWLGVDPKHQRRGIGAELLRRLERTARRLGAHKLYFYTAVKNIHAIELYRRLGFQIEGLLRQHKFGADLLIMGKVYRTPRRSACFRKLPEYPIQIIAGP